MVIFPDGTLIRKQENVNDSFMVAVVETKITSGVSLLVRKNVQVSSLVL